MKYNDFESKKEYLLYVKNTFYKNGMKCMVLSVTALLLFFLMGADTVKAVIGIPETVFWILQKVITGYFMLGAVVFLFSFFIKVDNII